MDALEEAKRRYWSTDEAVPGCRRAQRDAFVDGAVWALREAADDLYATEFAYDGTRQWLHERADQIATDTHLDGAQ